MSTYLARCSQPKTQNICLQSLGSWELGVLGLRSGFGGWAGGALEEESTVGGSNTVGCVYVCAVSMLCAFCIVRHPLALFMLNDLKEQTHKDKSSSQVHPLGDSTPPSF